MQAIIEQILSWLSSIGGRPIDLLFAAILFYVRWHDLKEIRLLRAKYELLNTLISNIGWIIRLTLGINAIKHHRSGDIEIVTAIDGIDTPKVYKDVE